ncbi:hypothetical protein [Flammeovirga kamogawensis]|nr:hypothetical protein [Flammeovirga kamogawensis]MBB6463302.1 hypothetical protein [Flammeovirga kamogawensis]
MRTLVTIIAFFTVISALTWIAVDQSDVVEHINQNPRSHFHIKK